MLNICSLASMEAYSRQIEKLVTQWPRCWGLIYTADDAARAEKLGKLRRRLTLESAQNRQVPRDWDLLHPWSCIFIQLAQDMEYWANRVHHPAAAWTAAGGRRAPTVASEAAVLDVIQGATGSCKLNKKPQFQLATTEGPKQTGTRDRHERGECSQIMKNLRGTGHQVHPKEKEARLRKEKAKARARTSQAKRSASAGPPTEAHVQTPLQGDNAKHP